MQYRFSKNDTVRTADGLLKERAFIAPKLNQKARRPDSPGLVVDYISNTYLVQHEDMAIAVYEEAELKRQPAYWEVRFSKSGVACYKQLAIYQDVESFISFEEPESPEITGPFYVDKEEELKEGPLESKSLFDHLTED